MNAIRPYKIPNLFALSAPTIRLPEENALIKVYGSTKLGDYGYVPFQGRKGRRKVARVP